MTAPGAPSGSGPPGIAERRRHVEGNRVTGLASACIGGRVSAHPRVSTALTWRADIKPLFDRQCVSCHASGNATNTVALATYEQVRPWIARSARKSSNAACRCRAAGLVSTQVSTIIRCRQWSVTSSSDGSMAVHLKEVRRDERGKKRRQQRSGAACIPRFAPIAPARVRCAGWSSRRSRRISRGVMDGACGRAPTRARPTHAHLTSRFESPMRRPRGRADFERVHEYPLHLFVVSEDFRDFHHVHPVMDARGEGPSPSARQRGRYWVYGDFLPADGAPQMLQRMISVETSSTPPRRSSPHRDR